MCSVVIPSYSGALFVFIEYNAYVISLSVSCGGLTELEQVTAYSATLTVWPDCGFGGSTSEGKRKGKRYWKELRGFALRQLLLLHQQM